jgi:hypothetical protein
MKASTVGEYWRSCQAVSTSEADMPNVFSAWDNYLALRAIGAFGEQRLSGLDDFLGKFFLAGHASLYWLDRSLFCRFPRAQ